MILQGIIYLLPIKKKFGNIDQFKPIKVEIFCKLIQYFNLLICFNDVSLYTLNTKEAQRCPKTFEA